MIFRQLFDSSTSTYTYILADPKTRDGVIIDPVVEKLQRDLDVIEELGIKLYWILDTHVHADHVTGAFKIREKTNAKIGMGKGANLPCADHLFSDGEIFYFGKIHGKVFLTPGHTNGCASYYINDSHVFTGDALLIRGCGRTDFQEGSSATLFKSVRDKLFSLPETTLVYPAHDYQGRTSSSIEEEKKFNPRLKLSNTESDFQKIMSELQLDHPKNIQIALPANVNCGKV